MAQEPESTAKRAELPMRLTRLRVKNFRSIADIDIPLSPLTVLVGPNGSGKSNVVDALRFVRDVFARGLDQAVMDREGMGVIQRWGTEGKAVSIEIEILSEVIEPKEYPYYNYAKHGILIPEKPAVSVIYKFDVVENSSKVAIVNHEKLTVLINEKKPLTLHFLREGRIIKGRIDEQKWVAGAREDSHRQVPSAEGQIWYPSGLFGFSYEMFRKLPGFFSGMSVIAFLEKIGIEITEMSTFVANSLFYTLNIADLRQPQRMLRETPFDEKGRNLAAVLRHLADEKSLGWSKVCFALRQAVTGFDRIMVELVGGYLTIKLIYETNDAQIRTSYLGQESDGTIRMLGLLAALQQEPAQQFISIEEPEANIHPGALAVLASVLDEASLHSQVFVTTHSPDMLDHLPVESFLVVEKVGDTTHVGPLDASQIASVRKRLFTPGELFRMEGLQRQAESAS